MEDTHDILTFISSLRESLGGVYAEYCSADEKAILLQCMKDVEVWLLSAKANDTARASYEQQHAEICGLGKRIADRYRESQGRDQAVAHLRDVVHAVIGVVVEGGQSCANLSTLENGRLASEWLDGQLDRQAQLPKAVDPVLRIKDVVDKSNRLLYMFAFTMKSQMQNGVDLLPEIPRLQRLVQVVPGDHALHAQLLFALGRLLRLRSVRLGVVDDINESIARLREAANMLPTGHPDTVPFLRDLGIAYSTRFQRLGAIPDINDAIACVEKTLRVTSDDDELRPACLNSLGNAFLRRFGHSGDLANINLAILSHEEAVRITPDGHADKPIYLHNLGNSLAQRFEWQKQIADIDSAIASQVDAAFLTPDDDPAKPGRLNSLGNLFVSRFENDGDIADIGKAISSQRQAVAIAPDSDAEKPTYLSSLGASLVRRFERLGDVADIDNAVSMQNDAVYLMPDSHLDKAGCLIRLGISLARRFERLGEIADINDAISALKHAISIVPDGHPDKAKCIIRLGSKLAQRFERLGDVADVDEAIASLEDAVRNMPDSHPDKAGCLNNLGTSLLLRFDHLGEVADIDRAISCEGDAVRITADGNPSKARFLTNLGNSLERRFERLGDIADVDNAIASQEDAVRFTPDGHPEKPGRLCSLGDSLMMRFERIGAVADINGAVSNHGQAVRIMPDDHRAKAIFLNNFGSSLRVRFEQLGNMADLDEAISSHEAAVRITPHDHPDKPMNLTNLGTSLATRFERLGDVNDVDRAIASQTDAVRSTPAGHPDKSRQLGSLGRSLARRFERIGDIADLRQCAVAYSGAAGAAASPPSWRFRAAVAWAKYAHLLGDASVLEAYDSALDLLPRLAWVGVSMDSRYRELRSTGALACDAAAAALAADDPQRALEWLEQGRSVVWRQTLQLRTPLDELRAADLALADRFARVSAALEQGGHGEGRVGPRTVADLGGAAEQVAQRRRRLAEEWEELVQQVRALPGLERFLLPTKCTQLLGVARVGPVVVLNVSKLRCDALILVSPSESLRHVRLDKFSYERAQELQKSLRGLLFSLKRRGPGEESKAGPTSDTVIDEDAIFRTLLEELWISVVKPVLDCLSSQSASRNPPRIWWCPTGPLTFLPIHAAGLYPPGSARPLVSVADFIVSSYTPTLSALITALQPATQHDIKLLTVIHPGTGEIGLLPGTEEELSYIRKRASSLPIRTLAQADATVAEVLSGMDECAWVHFACHGVQDAADPTESGLVLEDGRLRLSALVSTPLVRAEFAFLSACQTATGDEGLPDEAVHLAAGMLLAGYRGVVATMWSIGDGDAPFVADRVYARLFSDADGRPCRMDAARALHAAVQRLQKRHKGRSFASWVPFIHVGA